MKKTPEELRRKVRSLETMLSRERVYASQLDIIATAATAALEKVNNGEIKEGCRIIRAALGEARAAGGGGVAGSACCPACKEITCDEGCENAEARAAGGN